MTPPEQLPLPLPVRTALGREAYFVSQSNAMAVALIENWQDWPARKFVLTGPASAGKTHLAHVWVGLAQARLIPAKALTDKDIPTIAERSICVEDVDRIAGARAAEEALFHTHNLTLANGNALLMTARSVPAHWPLVLPDLKSRLMGTQGATLPEPDDALLAALLAKLFADRQIVPDAAVIPFLLRRMPRDHAAAPVIVEALDRAALARKSAVTRPLAQTVLAALTAEGLAENPDSTDT